MIARIFLRVPKNLRKTSHIIKEIGKLSAHLPFQLIPGRRQRIMRFKKRETDRELTAFIASGGPLNMCSEEQLVPHNAVIGIPPLPLNHQPSYAVVGINRADWISRPVSHATSKSASELAHLHENSLIILDVGGLQCDSSPCGHNSIPISSLHHHRKQGMRCDRASHAFDSSRRSEKPETLVTLCPLDHTVGQ